MTVGGASPHVAPSGDRAFLPRDFVETADGLVFAVVASDQEAGRIPAALRYRRSASGFVKLSTQAADIVLRSTRPDYLFHSRRRDVPMHGVPLDCIAHHYRPRQRIRDVIAAGAGDAFERALIALLDLFAQSGVAIEWIGVSGSLLIGAQQAGSDIDLVIYGREPFSQARRALAALTDAGAIEPLDAVLWRATYARRGCNLSFDDYVWHERRKFNKGAIGGIKFDLGLVADAVADDSSGCRKLGRCCLQASVTDDTFAFDSPARYRIEHPQAVEVLSFTATYAGQARTGERIEVCGQLEETDNGARRIVVGSSREAAGQYLRVVRGSS